MVKPFLPSFDSEKDGDQDLPIPWSQPFPQPCEIGMLLFGEIDQLKRKIPADTIN